MLKNSTFLLTLIAVLFMAACEEDDPLLSPDHQAIRKIKDTEILLRNNLWGFHNLIVDVKYEMRAIPLLANVADQKGMVQPGQYNSYDIFGNDHRQKNYGYQFTTTKIYRDTTGNDAYYQLGSYNVLNATEIRMNPDSIGPMSYTYKYLEDKGLYAMTSDYITNGIINEAVNQIIADAIYSGKPNDIANAVVDKILGNEEVQAAIQQLLYDLMHGKLEDITQSPEEISEKLATLIIQKLKEVDWESLVYDKLVALLGELKVDNPEQAAQEVAEQIANRIETSISQSDIYEAILPILQRFEDETLPSLVPNIADAIYKVITKVFSEDNIYNKIYPVWTSFSQVDSITIVELADTLTTTFTNHFFDAETLATSLEPFIATLRSTSTVKIPALAQDIIDDVLKPLVDQLNATFPGLELDPDWNTIKQLLSSALTIIKSSLDDQSDAEAAAGLANFIIDIMDSAISKGVQTAIFSLQNIPADQAAQVIAAWVYNLVEVAEPGIVAFLEDELNGLVDMFNAEELAENLSAIIHNKILEVFSADNIYNFVLPVMERLSDLNVEAAAEKIAGWLTGWISENISEEEVLNALTAVISQLIGTINVEDASQKLVDLILQSELVENIDGAILKQLIEFKTYVLLTDLFKEINAIDKIEISIVIK